MIEEDWLYWAVVCTAKCLTTLPQAVPKLYKVTERLYSQYDESISDILNELH